MNKKLLTLFTLFFVAFSYAQVVSTEDFDGMAIGNIGSDLTGAAAGQNDWFTYNSTGGTNNDNSNYQVVLDGTNQVLQLTGSNAATGTKYMWQDGFSTAWTNRTVGNEIVEVEYDFYTGDVTTSKNTVRTVFFDTAVSKMLAGFYYIPETRVLKGLAYYNNAGTLNNYIFTLGTTDVVLTANTWYHLGFSWNNTTGEVKWKSSTFNVFVMGAGAGIAVGEFDFLATAGTGNTVASVTKFDNYVIRITATDTLLGIENSNTTLQGINIFPTLTKDIVNIVSDNQIINFIKITDVNGKLLQSIETNSMQTSVNVNDLQTGIYFMTVVTEKGTSTTKIIKE